MSKMGFDTLGKEIKNFLTDWLQKPSTLDLFETQIVDKFTQRLAKKMYPYVLYMFLIFLATLGSIVLSAWFIIRTWHNIADKKTKKKGKNKEENNLIKESGEEHDYNNSGENQESGENYDEL